MRLTEEGKRFCTEALPLLAHLESVAEDAANATGVARGRLRVNIDPTFARVYLAPRVGAFLEAHPELQLELSVRDQIGDLIAEGLDAALRFGEPEPSSLIARRLLQVRVLTCAAPAYIARRGRPRIPRDLQTGGHECLLFRDPATGRPFQWEFHQGKKKLTVEVSGRLVVNDAQVQLEACTAGHGIAQVMDFSAAPLLESGKLVNLFPEWADELFPLYLYHPSRHFVPAKLRVFSDFIVSSLNLK
jgi:DNA-binding transcriptional LysR family regulator